MSKNHFKLILAFTLLVGFSLACESISAIREDYTEVRGTAGSVATQAQEVITQAKGIATQLGDSKAVSTARAIATEKGPAFIATGEALTTQAAEEGYLQTAEALVTRGASELLPTVQAVATQYLNPAPPPDDIPIINSGDVTYLFTNQSTVSYYTEVDLAEVIDYYQISMPEEDWIDVTDSSSITEQAAVLKFFKPDKVATISLTANQLNEQTVVLITIRSQ
jgi:hypothetical protein